ncbi:hypothetical protein PHMEG_00024355 [Phytophthora megakarya]|uniref:Uncharacterized protein n=1 Tax=Phytophthora megakarya TaxID=4795 RepID=A0A225VGE4_9STRA|nr:hypothetical protein PHMEG_00024355 [Phytophthora megakarya]
MISYLYSTASCRLDYQNAALLCLSVYKHNAPGKTSTREDQVKRPRDKDESVLVKRRRRSKTTHTNKHKKLDSKQLVAFMRLFIDDRYALDDSSSTHKDNVRQLGELASQEFTAFLSTQAASRGDPNDRIFAYQLRLAVGRIVDSAPIHCLSALKVRS